MPFDERDITNYGGYVQSVETSPLDIPKEFMRRPTFSDILVDSWNMVQATNSLHALKNMNWNDAGIGPFGNQRISKERAKEIYDYDMGDQEEMLERDIVVNQAVNKVQMEQMQPWAETAFGQHGLIPAIGAWATAGLLYMTDPISVGLTLATGGVVNHLGQAGRLGQVLNRLQHVRNANKMQRYRNFDKMALKTEQMKLAGAVHGAKAKTLREAFDKSSFAKGIVIGGSANVMEEVFIAYQDAARGQKNRITEAAVLGAFTPAVFSGIFYAFKGPAKIVSKKVDEGFKWGAGKVLGEEKLAAVKARVKALKKIEAESHKKMQAAKTDLQRAKALSKVKQKRMETEHEINKIVDEAKTEYKKDNKFADEIDESIAEGRARIDLKRSVKDSEVDNAIRSTNDKVIDDIMENKSVKDHKKFYEKQYKKAKTDYEKEAWGQALEEIKVLQRLKSVFGQPVLDLMREVAQGMILSGHRANLTDVFPAFKSLKSLTKELNKFMIDDLGLSKKQKRLSGDEAEAFLNKIAAPFEEASTLNKAETHIPEAIPTKMAKAADKNLDEFNRIVTKTAAEDGLVGELSRAFKEINKKKDDFVKCLIQGGIDVD